MSNFQHKNTASGRWNQFNLMEQMANIGSEVERMIKWRNKNNIEYANLAFERALELFDLTAIDQKNKNRLKEVLRARELLVDFFKYGNKYKSNDESWRKYFYYYNYAARSHSSQI